MNITVKKRKQNRNTQFCVYYNDWNGDIISIGQNIREDLDFPYIVTSESLVYDIFANKLRLNDCVVDLNAGNNIVRKNQDYADYNEMAVIPIKERAFKDWDIKISYNKKTFSMLFSLNEKLHRRLYIKNNEHYTKFKTPINLIFYVIQKGRPDYLLETISISIDELVDTGHHYVDMSHKAKYFKNTDIEILTEKFFNRYIMMMSEHEIHELTPNYDNSTSLWNVAETSDQGFILVSRDDDHLVFERNHEREFDQIQIVKPFFHCFIIGETPDIYHGSITLDLAQIRLGQQERYKIHAPHNFKLIFQHRDNILSIKE